MPSVATIREKPDGNPSIHIDLSELEAPMKEALRRSAAYLGYASHLTEGAPLRSVSLGANVELSVGVPEPIPAAERKNYQREFRSWAIGLGLIEIDQAYQRFLASALETVTDVLAFDDRGRLAEHKPNLANTWTVHEKFYSTVGQRSTRHDEESSFLRSLGNARNCLAHDSGMVEPRRLTDGDTMPVRWRGRDMFQIGRDGGHRLLPRDRPHKVNRNEVGLELRVGEVTREMIYKASDRISFSATDLSEIIFFYQDLAMQVGGEMHRFTDEMGQKLNS